MPYRVGQPQGIAPTEDRILCFRGKSFRAAKTFASEGNPLWLPLTKVALSLQVRG